MFFIVSTKEPVRGKEVGAGGDVGANDVGTGGDEGFGVGVGEVAGLKRAQSCDDPGAVAINLNVTTA